MFLIDIKNIIHWLSLSLDFKVKIKERDKKIQALTEMIDDLEGRIKDQNIVLDSNNN